MAYPDYGSITIRGARENNLKNISLDIPKRKITVCTGVSGSGARLNAAALESRVAGQDACPDCNGLGVTSRSAFSMAFASAAAKVFDFVFGASTFTPSSVLPTVM